MFLLELVITIQSFFLTRSQENIEGHLGTGTWTCMIPNRISYFFNFRGPSIPVDTACSSSLVALPSGNECSERKGM